MTATDSLKSSAAMYRFADAHRAIDKSAKTVRNWHARNQVTMSDDRADGGWAQYTAFDIAVLAVVGTLTDFGLKVELADKLAHEALRGIRPQGMRFDAYVSMVNSDPGTLAALWTDRSLAVWPEGERYRLQIVDNWGRDRPEANAFLAVQMEPLLREVFKRLAGVE